MEPRKFLTYTLAANLAVAIACRIQDIITEPDFIGINPNETTTSFELIKKFEDNILIGIKLDTEGDYLYIATLHDVTDAKIAKRLANGRLKNVDKTL